MLAIGTVLPYYLRTTEDHTEMLLSSSEVSLNDCRIPMHVTRVTLNRLSRKNYNEVSLNSRASSLNRTGAFKINWTATNYSGKLLNSSRVVTERLTLRFLE